MNCAAFVLAGLCLLPVCALAAEPTPTTSPYTTLQAGASSEQLTNRRGSWRSAYLLYVRHNGTREKVYGGLSNYLRFGKSDVQYLGGVYVPSSPNTVLNVELNVSPTHAVLPQIQLSAALDHRLASGWGYELGAGYRGYAGLHADSATFQIDRYWRSFRAAYIATGTQLSNTSGVSLSHSALFTHFYRADTLSSIAASLAAGREVENIGTSWVLENTRQGAVYTRSGGQIGLIHRL